MKKTCDGCLYEKLCSLFPEKVKHTSCKEMKIFFESHIPPVLKPSWYGFKEVFHFTSYMKGSLDIGISNFERNMPLMCSVTEINYDNLDKLIELKEDIPLAILIVSDLPEKILDHLILASQLFGDRECVLYIPLPLLESDFRKNLFILSQLGLKVLLDIRDTCIERAIDFCVLWLQESQVDIYPYSSFLADFFRRVFNVSFFYLSPTIERLSYEMYKDFPKLRAEFFKFYHSCIDIESFLVQVRDSVTSFFAGNPPETVMEAVEDLSRNYKSRTIDILPVCENEKLYLLKSIDVNCAPLDIILVDIDHGIMKEVLKDKAKTDHLRSVFFYSQEVLVNVDKIFPDVELLKSLDETYKGFPVSWWVSKDMIKNKDFVDFLDYSGRPVIFKINTAEELADILASFADADVGYTVEPLHTLFRLYVEGVDTCSFIESLYSTLSGERMKEVFGEILRDYLRTGKENATPEK